MLASAAPERRDQRVHLLELRHRAPDQDDLGAAARRRQRQRAADAIARAGDGDDAPAQRIAAGLEAPIGIGRWCAAFMGSPVTRSLIRRAQRAAHRLLDRIRPPAAARRC